MSSEVIKNIKFLSSRSAVLPLFVAFVFFCFYCKKVEKTRRKDNNGTTAK